MWVWVQVGWRCWRVRRRLRILRLPSLSTLCPRWSAAEVQSLSLCLSLHVCVSVCVHGCMCALVNRRLCMHVRKAYSRCLSVHARGWAGPVNRILGYMRDTMKTGFATVEEAAASIAQYTANRTVRRTHPHSSTYTHTERGTSICIHTHTHTHTHTNKQTNKQAHTLSLSHSVIHEHGLCYCCMVISTNALVCIVVWVCMSLHLFVWVHGWAVHP
jgi:hypothetical protein